MSKLYTYSKSIRYLHIIYLISLFSFFINADLNLRNLNLPNGFQIDIFANEIESPKRI